MATISNFLQEHIDAGDFPSAVYLVAEKDQIVLQDALGFAVVQPERIEATIDTIYDLASLTKVLVTGLLAAKLIEQEVLSLEDRVDRFFTSIDSKDGTTLKQIVTHTSGLKAWMPFYLLPGAPESDEYDFGSWSQNLADISDFVTTAILSELHNPHADVLYSDLNFILLGRLIEEYHGLILSTIVLNEIVDRLSLQRTFTCGTGSLFHETAASEKGNAYEKQLCLAQGYLRSKNRNPVATAPGSDKLAAFRTETIWGEVHDGNAYFMGGVAGHAGLFSTAEEIFKIAQQFLPNYTTLLKPETCELFRTNFTQGMNEDRSFAFQLGSTKDSTAGSKMSPESFGHTGFTGTSLWIDPVKERIFILLTNRTHNHALPFANINSVRRRFHDLAIEYLDKNY